MYQLKKTEMNRISAPPAAIQVARLTADASNDFPDVLTPFPLQSWLTPLRAYSASGGSPIRSVGREPFPLRYGAQVATSPTDTRVLVTGAYGCIGAWVVRELVERDVPVVTFDLGGDDYRLGLVLSRDRAAQVPRVNGDITDLAALERALDEHERHERDPPRSAAGALTAARTRHSVRPSTSWEP